MLRTLIIALSLAVVCDASSVNAQHSHHQHGNRSYHSGEGHYWSGGPVAYGYPVGAGTSYGLWPGHHSHRSGYAPLIIGTGPVWFPSAGPVPIGPLAAPTIAVIPVVHNTALGSDNQDPSKRPAKPSTPAGRLKALEHQARGDEKLRKQLWAQAYVHYRSAADAAGDQGEAHFRLGFVYTAMQYYPSAVREFKRGLFLSPDLPASGIRMSMLFGPDSEIVRISILNKVADWVREDPRDPDRLFLLGLLLHFEDDPRRREVLQVARSMAVGSFDHIHALLARPDAPAPKKILLETLPLLPEVAKPLPDPPKLMAVPSPLAPPGPAPLQQVGPPQPPPPIGLPVLLDKPTPPVVPGPPAGKP